MGKSVLEIISGILAMIWSFLLVGIIAVFVVSGMMYAEVGSDDGLRESGLLKMLITGELISGIGCAITMALSRFIR